MESEDDFAGYERGALAMLKSRQDPCYIPEDDMEDPEEIYAGRDVHGTLFYNRSGPSAEYNVCQPDDEKILFGLPGSATTVPRMCATAAPSISLPTARTTHRRQSRWAGPYSRSADTAARHTGQSAEKSSGSGEDPH